MKISNQRLLVTLAVTLAAIFLPAPQLQGGEDHASLFERSLVSAGNAARLENVFAKARRGEPVTVAVIGGSITQGARASKTEYQYGSLVAEWWRKTFPKASISFRNAGVGATGSDYGALRAPRDLIAYRPDFVIVEFSVNDGDIDGDGRAECLEGLLRQILGQTNQPAVMLLFMMHKGGGNGQAWHSAIGRHYELPMISFRDALYPEVEAGRVAWADIETDTVHPNDRGHDYAARLVIQYLDQCLRWKAATPPVIKPLPAPKTTDLFEHVSFREANQLNPARNEGWTTDASGKLVADKPGSVAEFEIEGSDILIAVWHQNGAFGKASLQVDDLPPVIHDSWYDQTWGGYRETVRLGRGLKPGKHRVRVELLEEKNPLSTGHEFRIVALGAAGVSVP